MEDIGDFFDYMDIMHNNRLGKRYIRDVQNPIEYFSDAEFKTRYRFSKETIQYILLPLVHEELNHLGNRGLPISPLISFLTCLRFYATGSFQVNQFLDKCYNITN